jgi:hypothetical protein
MTESGTLLTMLHQIKQWEAVQDRRSIFLSCYSTMTRNVLQGIADHRFIDPGWVARLVDRFADYYFQPLYRYDQGETQVPLVWRRVHDASTRRSLHVLQHLMLGVNAHINYDLVITLAELLQGEWDSLPEDRQQDRFSDHCKINQIIAETIDEVQDRIVVRMDWRMDIVDKLLGRLDEKLCSGLITYWRAEVWENALQLLRLNDDTGRREFLNRLENKVMEKSRWFDPF